MTQHVGSMQHIGCGTWNWDCLETYDGGRYDLDLGARHIDTTEN